MASTLLENILSRQNRAATLKVVFVDVTSYSKRRSQSQSAVVDSLTTCLQTARRETGKAFIDYSTTNKVDFQSDLICLPSGDGAAVVFPFEGLHDVHLRFALELLKAVHDHNNTEECEKFKSQGWCNCHAHFSLAIGVSEGRGILYKDLNGNYNVSGTVINMAARALSLAGANQIIFTEDAYRQIIDMVDDPHLDEKFRIFRNARIKHNRKVNVYQYRDGDLPYLNSEPPEELELMMQTTEAIETLSKSGFPPVPSLDMDKKQFVAFMKQMASMMTQFTSIANVVDAESVTELDSK